MLLQVWLCDCPCKLARVSLAVRVRFLLQVWLCEFSCKLARACKFGCAIFLVQAGSCKFGCAVSRGNWLVQLARASWLVQAWLVQVWLCGKFSRKLVRASWFAQVWLCDKAGGFMARTPSQCFQEKQGTELTELPPSRHCCIFAGANEQWLLTFILSTMCIYLPFYITMDKFQRDLWFGA